MSDGKIADSMTLLPRMVYERAREIYGEEIPKYIENRLQNELDRIIGNGDYSYVFVAWHEALDIAGFLPHDFWTDLATASCLVSFLCGITNREPEDIKKISSGLTSTDDNSYVKLLGESGKKKPHIILYVHNEDEEKLLRSATMKIHGMGRKILPKYVLEFGNENEFEEIIRCHEDGDDIYNLENFADDMDIRYESNYGR